MSALPEGGDQRKGWPVAGPFAKTEFIEAVGSGVSVLSTDVSANAPCAASSVVEACFGRRGDFESSSERVESVRFLSKRGEGIADVFLIYHRTSFREVRERCFYEFTSLRGVIFGASSRVERICAYAFCRTSIESLSIPDSVVDLGERCFYECTSLRRVIFGAASNLERICAGAFYGTSIESLSIPDSVVALM